MKTDDLLALADREIELLSAMAAIQEASLATVAVIRALRDKVKAQSDKLRDAGMSCEPKP